MDKTEEADGLGSVTILTDLAAAILACAGASNHIAQAVAEQLVEAEIVGRASHGLRLVGRYVDKLRAGEVSGAAMPLLGSDDGGPIVRIDGNGAFGQIVGDLAAEKGVRRARRHGIAVVLIRSATQLGRNARWSEYAARQGMASMHFVHGGGPLSVVPFGASEAKMGTSPIALGAPSPDGDHVIIDFSTAEVSSSRATLAAERGERLGSSAIVLPDGTQSHDPAALIEGLGALLPFGGFKGYGIAVFAQIFGGLLTSSEGPKPRENRMLSIYLDVGTLTDFDSYGRRLSEMIAAIRSARPLPGTEGVVIPGDRSRQHRRKSAVSGYSPSPTLICSLREAAKKAGLDLATDRWRRLNLL